MKKLYVLIILLSGVHALYAQQQKDTTHHRKFTPASQLDQLIADKMRATLDLEPAQWRKILRINQEISEQKKNAFKSSTDREKVGTELQRIEDERESRYCEVLSEKQQNLYKQKRKYLLSSNQ